MNTAQRSRNRAWSAGLRPGGIPQHFCRKRANLRVPGETGNETLLRRCSLLHALAAVALLWLSTLPLTAAEKASIDITEYATGVRRIPISVSGFTGEVLSVLKFDLEVVGFRITAPEEAQFILSGSNEGQVEGRLVDRIAKSNLLANRYTGASVRLQAHTLADEVVQKITGMPGIARTKIAFRGGSGTRTEIYVSDYDGANATAVTQDNALVVAPSWVPRQRALFYTSYVSGNMDIYSQDLTSGLRQRITRFAGLNTSPAPSPDGRKVAMILSKGGSPDLYVGDADGRNLIQLTKTRDVESDPCWSPDGRQICFMSRNSGLPQLYVISPAGGTMQRIRTAGATIATEPDWSPDGKSIVFTRQRGSEFMVCVVPAQGGEAVELKPGEDPCWAANSRTVIFTQRQKNRTVLSLLDVPTKEVKTLNINLGSCLQPSWAK